MELHLTPSVNRLDHESGASELDVSPEQPGGLPAWPLKLVFVGYPIWWVLGVGDMALGLAAAFMVHQLLRRRVQPVTPAGFGVWLLFLAWVAASVVRLDSALRLIGFGYRGLIYVAATIAFIYIYSDRRTFSLQRVAGLLSGFWGVLVVGGYLGVIWPLLTLRTPLACVLPQGLLANELVNEMAIRRVTQFNPDAWIVLAPRPSAPFPYTNGWGNAYSILTPVVIAYAFQLSGWRRFTLIAAIVASLVPAFLTLNRGMFIGLGVAGIYITIRSVASGQTRTVLGVAAAALIAVIAFALLGVQDRLSFRLEASPSTESRSSLYQETLDRVLESPILGYGAPRPSGNHGLPSAGTQGHFWMVAFSHGYPQQPSSSLGSSSRSSTPGTSNGDRTGDAHGHPRHHGGGALLRLRQHGPCRPHGHDRRRLATTRRVIVPPTPPLTMRQLGVPDPQLGS